MDLQDDDRRRTRSKLHQRAAYVGPTIGARPNKGCSCMSYQS